MPDYSSLVGVAPYFAAFQMGSQGAQESQTTQLKQQELQQIIAQKQAEEQRKQQMQPYELEKAGLVNQEYRAKNPGFAADSDLKRTTASIAQQTMPGQVAAKNSENDDVVKKNTYEQAQRSHAVFMQAGPMLQQVPPPLRAQKLREYFEASGMNVNSPQLQSYIQMAQQDPTGFPQKIQKIADDIGRNAESMSSQARSAKAVAGIQAASHERVADKQAASHKEVAEIQAKAKVEAAKGKTKDLMTRVLTGELSSDKAITAALWNSQNADTPEEKDIWSRFGKSLETRERGKAQARDEGRPQLNLEQGGLTPKTVPSAFGESPLKESTAGKTSSGVGYKIIPQ